MFIQGKQWLTRVETAGQVRKALEIHMRHHFIHTQRLTRRPILTSFQTIKCKLGLKIDLATLVMTIKEPNIDIERKNWYCRANSTDNNW